MSVLFDPGHYIHPARAVTRARFHHCVLLYSGFNNTEEGS